MKRVEENAVASNICMPTICQQHYYLAPPQLWPQLTARDRLSDPNLLASVTQPLLVAYCGAVTIHCMIGSLLGKCKCRICAVPMSA